MQRIRDVTERAELWGTERQRIMNRQELLEKYNDLFWYFDKSRLRETSDVALVEFILNYGDMRAVKDLFETLGKEKTAYEFAKAAFKERNNYFPQVVNFFDLYFKKNVSGYPFE